MQQQKRQQTHYYNRNARDLPSLKTGQPVYAQLVPRTRNWTQGHIIERLSQRTYKIRTHNGGTYIRNRKFIKPRYTDSRQSLQTSNRVTEHAKNNDRAIRVYSAKKSHQKTTETNRDHELKSCTYICIYIYSNIHRRYRYTAF